MEDRDRLARFGAEHLDTALATHDRRMAASDLGETADDLVREMMEVLTLMCVRPSGRRGARTRAMRAMTAARNTDVSVAA